MMFYENQKVLRTLNKEDSWEKSLAVEGTAASWNPGTPQDYKNDGEELAKLAPVGLSARPTLKLLRVSHDLGMPAQGDS